MCPGSPFLNDRVHGVGCVLRDIVVPCRVPAQERLAQRAQQPDPYPATDRDQLVGLLWHHALHTRVCLDRRRWWQAEHWISAMRDHVITMACARLSLPAANAKGAHLLPDDLTAPLQATLVRELTEPELRRALTATITVVADEIARFDPALDARLRPMFADLTGSMTPVAWS
jgi:hypothetical protein